MYPSAQRRKLREFAGYRRVAVVIVTDEDTLRERASTREAADGKEVPDPAALDMKGDRKGERRASRKFVFLLSKNNVHSPTRSMHTSIRTGPYIGRQ